MNPTMRFLALLTLLGGLALAAPALGADGDASQTGQPSGTLVTYQGHKLQVLRFKNLLPAYTFQYQGVIQSLPMKQIKSLSIKGGGILVEKRDGVTLRVVGSLIISSSPALEFVFKDTLGGGEQEGRLDPILVSRVEFN